MFVFGLFLFFAAIIALSFGKLLDTEAQRSSAKRASFLLIVVGVVISFSSMVKVINAGTVGVVRTFGKVDELPLTEGLHMVNPFSTVEQISIRTEQYTMSGVRGEGAIKGDDAIRTLTRDGLPLPIDITVAFRPVPSMVPWLYRNIGMPEDYIGKIIRPASRAAVRDAVASFTAQEAYTTKREMLSATITKEVERYVRETLAKSEGYRGEAFVVQQVLIRNIELPDKLKASIEAKLTAEQEALRMEYVLQKEKQEAERKRIEARGIADFQAIVSQGLNDKLLKWKGIEATQALADSQNSKIIVIGGGKDGLPIILNGDPGTAAHK